MELADYEKIERELFDFVEHFRPLLGRRDRADWCEKYLCGLMLEGERKSIQPMSERVPGGDEQAMQQFVNQSPWDSVVIQDALWHYTLQRHQLPKGVLILDDTALPKKGKHSVGVARQYCGALGKIANCQSVVSWHYASEHVHFPCVGELYLPEEWTKDLPRMKKVGVPQRRFDFQKKWQLALDLLDRITSISYHVITMDAGYGECREFLKELDAREEKFIAQIPESHGFWPLDIELNEKNLEQGRTRQYPQIKDRSQKARSAKQWAQWLEKNAKWKSITLPLQTPKTVEVCEIEVWETTSGAYYRPGPKRRLIIQKNANGEIKYFVSNLDKGISLKQVVLWANERWKIEQGYQQLKEELGLDHFEGRSWNGLHHHITLCFMAYVFLLGIKKNLMSG